MAKNRDVPDSEEIDIADERNKSKSRRAKRFEGTKTTLNSRENEEVENNRQEAIKLMQQIESETKRLEKLTDSEEVNETLEKIDEMRITLKVAYKIDFDDEMGGRDKLIEKVKSREEQLNYFSNAETIEKAEKIIEELKSQLLENYGYNYDEEMKNPNSQNENTAHQEPKGSMNERSENMANNNKKEELVKKVADVKKAIEEAEKKSAELYQAGHKSDSEEVIAVAKQRVELNDQLISLINQGIYMQIQELKEKKKTETESDKINGIDKEIKGLHKKIEKNKEGYSEEHKKKKEESSKPTNSDKTNKQTPQSTTSQKTQPKTNSKSEKKSREKTQTHQPSNSKATTEKKTKLQSEIEQLETEKAMLLGQFYTNDSPEVKQIEEKLNKLYEQYSKLPKDESHDKKQDSKPKMTAEQLKIQSQIDSKEQELAILYGQAYTDNSPEVIKVQKEIRELYSKMPKKTVEQKEKENKPEQEEKESKPEQEKKENKPEIKITPEQARMKREIEKNAAELEARKQMLYAEGKIDSSPEIKQIQEELNKLYEAYSKLPKEKQKPKMTAEQLKIQNEIDKIEEEIQMGIMEGRYSDDSAEVKEMRERQNALRKQMYKTKESKQKTEPSSNPEPNQNPESNPNPNPNPNPEPEPNPDPNSGLNPEPNPGTNPNPLPIRRTHKVGLMQRVGNLFAGIVNFFKKIGAKVKPIFTKIANYTKLDEDEIDDLSEEITQNLAEEVKEEPINLHFEEFNPQPEQENIEASSQLANEPITVDLEEDEERDLQGAIRDIHNLNKNKMEIPDFMRRGNSNAHEEENGIDDEPYGDEEEYPLSEKEQKAQEKRAKKEAKRFAKETRKRVLKGNPVVSYGEFEFEDFVSRKNIEEYESGKLESSKKLISKDGKEVYLNPDGSLTSTPKKPNAWRVEPEDMGKDVPEAHAVEAQEKENVK